MEPITGFVSAIDAAQIVLMIGAFIGVVTATGAIDAGIKRAMTRLKGPEKRTIPVLIGLFALGGTSEGMAEETLAFYVLLSPLMIAAGYVSTTAANSSCGFRRAIRSTSNSAPAAIHILQVHPAMPK